MGCSFAKASIFAKPALAFGEALTLAFGEALAGADGGELAAALAVGGTGSADAAAAAALARRVTKASPAGGKGC